MPSRQQIRSIVAWLCIAAVLLAVAAPAGHGLLWAVLTTICIIVASDTRAHRDHTEFDKRAPLSGVVALVPARAPPAA